MDLSYTDPSFHPIYTLQGISQPLLQVGHDLYELIQKEFIRFIIFFSITVF